jgi:siroheme synthase
MSNLLTPPAVTDWLDAKRVFHQFTLGRSVLARLEREGKIRSCSLADVGKARGKKLYNVQSIHDFLNSRANAGKVEAQ